ncbi:hypothetical protein [Streptomyces sp. NBC_01727]|uniref:hypothetical protein n=1 Tax=Streptomyces sp. NBC_01727 TaxID=2975924 RepID=UPI002E100B6F|nr:hypothetical protein OIE76_40915 [Streptomyces sp. NBC_01727]
MDSFDPMNPQAVFSALGDFCADRLGAEAAARLVGLARPGFGLTEAGPGEAGPLNFFYLDTESKQHQPAAWDLGLGDQRNSH